MSINRITGNTAGMFDNKAERAQELQRNVKSLIESMREMGALNPTAGAGLDLAQTAAVAA